MTFFNNLKPKFREYARTEAGTAEAGEAYYLMKPLKLQDLISKIDEVMGGGIE